MIGKNKHTHAAAVGIKLLRSSLGGVKEELAIADVERGIILGPVLADGILAGEGKVDVVLGGVEGLGVDGAASCHCLDLEGRASRGSGSDGGGGGQERDAKLELHFGDWVGELEPVG